MTEPAWYVYLLECQGARIYTGVTPNLDRRVTTHRIGRGALFTRINQPQRLLAAKPFSSQRAARLIEAQVKRMPAEGKRLLAHCLTRESAMHYKLYYWTGIQGRDEFRPAGAGGCRCKL